MLGYGRGRCADAQILILIQGNSLMAATGTAGNTGFFPCFSFGSSLKSKNISYQCNYFDALSAVFMTISAEVDLDNFACLCV